MDLLAACCGPSEHCIICPLIWRGLVMESGYARGGKICIGNNPDGVFYWFLQIIARLFQKRRRTAPFLLALDRALTVGLCRRFSPGGQHDGSGPRTSSPPANFSGYCLTLSLPSGRRRCDLQLDAMFHSHSGNKRHDLHLPDDVRPVSSARRLTLASGYVPFLRR